MTAREKNFPGVAVEEKANILLVDDNAAKRLALSSVLETLGHNVFMAESSQDVLRFMPQRDYAVVLLDIQMPDMDGFEVARLIRGQRMSAHTPIIFITAFHDADVDVRRGYSLGAVDYIFAPVIPEILCAKVSVFVDLAVMRHRLQTEIAERKRAAEEIDALNASLNQRAADLEAANKELESFTYAVSHDLRAPLRTIDGYAHMLDESYSGKLDDEGRRLLQNVRDGSRKMERLIEDLLAFCRFGRTPVSMAEFDMGGLARTVFGELVALDAAHVPELRLSELPKAHGDPALIRQVWANLLSNSIKYTSKQPRPVIEVTGHTDEKEHIYCVKDNGAGFDMRHYEKLFGIFQRLHDPEQYSGTGVGLAIVERVASRHGGRVWAEGKVGEGAAFFFSLPRSQQTGAAALKTDFSPLRKRG